MKILHVLPSIDPRLGGPTVATLELVTHLREIGVDAEIATTNDRGSGVFDFPAAERVIYQGVPVRFFKRSPLRRRQFIPSRQFAVWLWKHARDYDLIDIHYLFTFTSAVAAFISRRFGIPYVVHSQGQLSAWSLAQSGARKRLYSALVERRALNRAAMVLCTSGGEIEDVRAFGVHAPLMLLPHGVSAPPPNADARAQLRQRYGLAPDALVVLFLSRLHPKKQPDFLLEALRTHLPAHPALFALFAGTGDPSYEQWLRVRASELGVSDHVRFTGFIKDTEKDAALLGSDIFALPSCSENFGIAVAEALAAGLASIITDCVQIAPDLARAEAALVVENSREHFSDALGRLVQDSALRARFSASGREYARKAYNWSSIAETLNAAYRRAIS